MTAPQRLVTVKLDGGYEATIALRPVRPMGEVPPADLVSNISAEVVKVEKPAAYRNREFMLPVCRDHVVHLSFTRDFYQPKHWRKKLKCAKRNCPNDAEWWLVIEVTEEVFGR
ncbi:MAG: hypothetical protein JRN45_00695 [Nitrososphaerota archaeon]|nr:hypothetical protein [Nitrososphaerota archaeon]